MSQYVFHTLDVFTEHIFGGNPVAVFPSGVGLETEQMQAVAGERDYEHHGRAHDRSAHVTAAHPRGPRQRGLNLGQGRAHRLLKPGVFRPLDRLRGHAAG